jgi:hypothetical protein
MNRVKKYKINFNMPRYSAKIKLYETEDGRYQSFSEARMYKWKCEKCFRTFSNYELLFGHKTEVHSY